ncbi:MAG TPA: PASTA domain-containing protein [Patescibacteria group bacterium]|nr:PASTA domain-containing protein [Patescibacteria group bacterium]
MNEQRSGKKRYRAAVLYLAAAAAAFIVGVIMFNNMIMPRLLGRGDVVIVPDVRGSSVTIAEKKCADSGLTLVVVGNRISEEVPEGYIIEQNPAPSESLKEGRAIKVMLSAGRRMERVPQLGGRTLRQAEILIGDAGLRTGRVVRVFSHRKADNAVLASTPPAGASIPHGSSVDLLLAMCGEPRTLLMPDLVGMDLPFVKERLERLGITIARVVNRRERDKFPNTILDQIPKAGSPIKEGESIELIVSTVE